MSLEQSFNQHPGLVKKTRVAYLGWKQMELFIIGNNLGLPLWSLYADEGMCLTPPLA